MQHGSYLEKGPYHEAISWLKTNPNAYPFATNRFGEKNNALGFVQELYEKGCGKVYVTGIYDEERRIREEGGPYADTLIVILPEDPERREGIFQIYAEESADYVTRDVGQKELRFWWD